MYDDAHKRGMTPSLIFHFVTLEPLVAPPLIVTSWRECRDILGSLCAIGRKVS